MVLAPIISEPLALRVLVYHSVNTVTFASGLQKCNVTNLFDSLMLTHRNLYLLTYVWWWSHTHTINWWILNYPSFYMHWSNEWHALLFCTLVSRSQPAGGVQSADCHAIYMALSIKGESSCYNTWYKWRFSSAGNVLQHMYGLTSRRIFHLKCTGKV